MRYFVPLDEPVAPSSSDSSGSDGLVRIAAAGGGSASDPAGRAPQPWLPVNLLEEEANGGHAIITHVGVPDNVLLAAVRAARIHNMVEDVYIVAAGSFTSLESANDLVNHTLRSNPILVSEVANGKWSIDKAVNMRFGFPTGREAVRESPFKPDDVRMRKTYAVRVIIRHDARCRRGFRVITAFPTNNRPGAVVGDW